MAQDIGGRLRAFRKTAGMSQMKLADKVGVSYQQIQKYEKGSSKMSVERVDQLAGIFGVPITAIIYGDDAPEGLTTHNFMQAEIDLIMSYRQIISKDIRLSIRTHMHTIVKSQFDKGKV